MFAIVENGVTILLPKNKKRQHFRSETAVFNGESAIFWPRKNKLWGGGITSQLASQ